jgi:hypothetical protein
MNVLSNYMMPSKAFTTKRDLLKGTRQLQAMAAQGAVLTLAQDHPLQFKGVLLSTQEIVDIGRDLIQNWKSALGNECACLDCGFGFGFGFELGRDGTQNVYECMWLTLLSSVDCV